MQANWNQEQIAAFSKADDMYISPFYSDGKTPGTPTWIWSVVVDDTFKDKISLGRIQCYFSTYG